MYLLTDSKTEWGRDRFFSYLGHRSGEIIREKVNAQMYVKTENSMSNIMQIYSFPQILCQNIDPQNLIWTIHLLYERPSLHLIGYSLNIDVYSY